MKLNVTRGITNLNAIKPPRISDLPAWPAKDGCKEIYPHLTFLKNEIIKYKVNPTSLKRAIVTPIYNKDDPEIAENYRRISITGALSKVLGKQLYKQIKEYLLSNYLLSKPQFAFRTSYSTIDAILHCTDFFLSTQTFS